MKYGFVLPSGDARSAAELAYMAESEGWDGFFMWEPVWGIDPWVGLAAAAMRTQRIRLGTMLTPLPIRKPWKLASETATLDNLSGGRVILSVGLGAVDTGFDRFGEPTGRKLRAELMDEGLEILTGLWRGQPYQFDGQHYHLRETSFMAPPPPVQQPRIPIWVVGAFPRAKSMRRALRFDGLIPTVMTESGQTRNPTPEDIRQMKTYIAENRTADGPYEIIWEGTTPGEDKNKAADILQPWQAAGVTWWIESMWEVGDQAKLVERIRQGPPG